MRRIIVAALLCGLGLSAARAAPAGPDVTEIRNGKTPAHGERTVTLQERWRIGGLADEETLLGLVRSAAVDEAGNIYLVDSQLVTVLVYDSAGHPIGELGREGDGPGEFHRPGGLILLPDGTVGVLQSFPGGIVKLARDGTPAGRIEMGGDPTDGGMFSMRNVVTVGEDLVFSGTDMTRDESSVTLHLRIARCDLQGRVGTVYYERTQVRDLAATRREEAGTYVPDVWAVGPDGRLWIAPLRNGYRIDVYAPEGVLERTITREYEPWRRTDEELELAKMWMTPMRGRRQPEIVVEPTAADFVKMHVADDGRLWVLSSRGAHPGRDGIHSIWDVFDADGNFDERIALACEGTAFADDILFPGGGLVIVIRNMLDAAIAARGQSGGEETEAVAEPIEVIVYRLPAD